MKALSFSALMNAALYELYGATVVEGLQNISAKDLAEKVGEGSSPGYIIVALNELDDVGYVKLNNNVATRTSSITANGIRFVEKGLGGPASDFSAIRDRRDEFTEQKSIGVRTAPAADRVVSIDHNGGPALEIIAAAQELSKKIRRGNDLGDLTPEEAGVAEKEIEIIEAAFSAEYVRPDHVMKLARRTLVWIGEKAAGAAVGKAALALLLMIATFFGYHQ